MLFAVDKNDNRIHIDETHSNELYYCPFCGVPLITKKGNIRQHHFAHSLSYQCKDTWERNKTYDMSPWHNNWQKIFPKENQEVRLSLGETKHRADVMIGRTIVEFQHSIISEKIFDDRNNFYHNLGYKVVWLFDMSDIYMSGNLQFRESGDRLYFTWNNPKKAFNSYDIKRGNIDLFFQFSEEIVRVLDVSEFGYEEFETSHFMKKNEFLSYVGLNEGGSCALPDGNNEKANQQYLDFCKKYAISLNKQQERAVQAVEGSVLLLAVPGSGKTTVLVTRLGHMIINRGKDPRNMLAITFNKNAAIEMRNRFNKVFGEEIGRPIRFFTINALCNKIYNRYCEENGVSPKELLSNNKEIVRKIMQQIAGKIPTENDVLDLQQDIGYIKNMMIKVDDISELGKPYELKEMFCAYQKELKDNNQMDFDDQMIFALEILRKDKEICSKFKARYKYISVDEAQDTSKIQHEIIKIIAKGNNLFMVGDEDQSIYGFRAAYPKALLNFRYDYINPYIIKMEHNYRSTEQIVNKSKEFISKYKGRYDKDMVSERGTGEEVGLINVKTREEQYDYLLQVAKNATTDTAFLYRDNDSAVVLIDLLLRNNILFKLRAPERNFFEFAIVRDIEAYLELAIDEKNHKALERIINKGILFLNHSRTQEIIDYCKGKDGSVIEIARRRLLNGQEKNVRQINKLKNMMQNIGTVSPVEAIDRILQEGYKEYLSQKDLDFEKIEILRLLARNESDIQSFLKRITYLESIIKKGFESNAKEIITLSTIHSSKGQEYDTVYLVDVYDGRFPSRKSKSFDRSKDRFDSEQEERRMFYVGMTRAKNILKIFDIEEKESAFIDDIFPDVKKQRARRRWQEEQKKQEEIMLWSIEDRKRRIKEAEEFGQRLAERQKKQEEEEKKRREEERVSMEDVYMRIDQQKEPVYDYRGQRWVRCKICREVKLAGGFFSRGGQGEMNLGICSKCWEKIKS